MASSVVAPTVWGGPIRVQGARTDPWRSDISTADTIGIMRGLAHQYSSDPHVLASVAQACEALGPDASDRDIAYAIFYWTRANIRFIEDEALMYEQLGVRPEELDKELLIVPPALLQMPQPMGDCDDFSLLLACQFLSVGMRPYFVTVAADRSDPRKFSHIYIAVRLEDEDSYLCLDAGNRMSGIPPGWEIPKPSRKAIWTI
jgi:hypothetical protein